MSAAPPRPRTGPPSRLGRGGVSPPRPGRRDERGIVTLEWLLLLAAVAALAGSALVILQRVLDDTAEVPPDPLIRIAQFEVAAAIVADEAQKLYDADSTAYATQHKAHMENRCAQVFHQGVNRGIVNQGQWRSPGDTSNYPSGTPPQDVLARCTAIPGDLVMTR